MNILLSVVFTLGKLQMNARKNVLTMEIGLFVIIPLIAYVKWIQSRILDNSLVKRNV